MSELSTDPERERLIFGREVEFTTQDIAHFARDGYSEGAPIGTDTARELLEGGYMDPDDSQNRAPTAATLVDTAEEINGKTPAEIQVELEGYVVEPDRHDSRVTLTALIARPPRSATGGAIDTLHNEMGALIDEYPCDEVDFYGAGSVSRVWWD